MAVITMSALADAFEECSDEWKQFLNIKTGANTMIFLMKNNMTWDFYKNFPGLCLSISLSDKVFWYRPGRFSYVICKYQFICHVSL